MGLVSRQCSLFRSKEPPLTVCANSNSEYILVVYMLFRDLDCFSSFVGDQFLFWSKSTPPACAARPSVTVRSSGSALTEGRTELEMKTEGEITDV